MTFQTGNSSLSKVDIFYSSKSACNVTAINCIKISKKFIVKQKTHFYILLFICTVWTPYNFGRSSKLFSKIPQLFFLFFLLFPTGNDHEVEFHEIKIQLFHEIEFLIMRSKFNLFMRSNLSNNIDHEVDTLIMRSNFHNNAV